MTINIITIASKESYILYVISTSLVCCCGCLLECKLCYYKHYVDNIFVLLSQKNSMNINLKSNKTDTSVILMLTLSEKIMRYYHLSLPTFSIVYMYFDS